MNIILACRNKSRGEEAIKIIKGEFPEAKIDLMIVDMSDVKSITSFVNEIKNKKIDVDVFYHNAGIYRMPFELIDGKDNIINTNYYGPFILNSLLMPYLKSLNHEVKMIITSSVATKWSNFRIDPLEPNPKVSRMTRYSNSKRLDAYLFKYLYDNDKSNIEYFLIHPGFADTNLIAKAYKNKLYLWLVKAFTKVVANPPWESALPLVMVLDEQAKSGSFYGPKNFTNMNGMPGKNRFIYRYLTNVDETIKKTEDILHYKLL